VSIAKAIGTALALWVGRGHKQLSSVYPGMVADCERQKETINRLYRAAFNQLTKGHVIKIDDSNDLKTILQQTALAVDLWVQQMYLAQANRELL